MLSNNARHMIEASVPVLREHGEAITRRFYARMFEQHPELKNIFNMGNQASGAQQQSLASALYAYAANIDNQEVLAPAVNRIVHKHVSLGVRAEHYPIVGENLLAAIKETLGEAATPEIIEAWAEAYGLLADALIDAEKNLYQQKGIEPGEYRQVQVARKIRESETVTSFYLVPTDDKPLPDFMPGQYISVALNVDALGLRQARQYSLSASSDKEHWRISVKREDAEGDQPAGAVSNLLHDQIEEGDTLNVSVPCGDFTLDDSNDPVVLISAGVGVTPMMSMLHTIVDLSPERPVSFLHAARDGMHHPMKDELEALSGAYDSIRKHVCYELPLQDDREGHDYAVRGRLDLNRVDPAMLPANGRYYLCGPDGFMQQQRAALIERGIDPARIDCEVFGPALVGHLQ